MATGMLGYAAVGVNSITTDSVAITDYVAFTSETFQVTPNPLISQGITNKWDEQRAYNGLQTVGGNMSGEVHPTQIGWFLRSAFDATSTTQASAGAAAWYGIGGNSSAVFRVHQFMLGQTQFQSGSGSDVPTLTFEIARGPAIGTASAFAYYGMACNVLEISLEGGNMMRFSADFLGVEYGRKAATTPSYATPEAFLWSQCSVSVAGGGSNIFESFTMRVNNQMTQPVKIDGRLRPAGSKRNAFRAVEVNGSVAFETDTEYDRFLAGSEFPVRLFVTAQDSSRMVIDLPRVRYLTHAGPTAQGPGRIVIPFTGRAMFDPGSGNPGQVLLHNRRISPYTANSNG